MGQESKKDTVIFKDETKRPDTVDDGCGSYNSSTEMTSSSGNLPDVPRDVPDT